MKSGALIMLGILAVLAAIWVINYPTRPAVLGGPRPLPAPTCKDQHVANTSKGFVFKPCSAPLEHGVRYRFNAGHCGFGWLPDFDGSFWTLEDPDEIETVEFAHNQSSGTVEVVADDRALYRSWDDFRVEMVRHEGKLVTKDVCA